MPSKVKPIPEGYHSVTPYLIVRNAARAIDFYSTAFGAKEIYRMPDGEKIGHAELQVGTSRIMLGDEFPDRGAKSAQSIGGTPVNLMVYVEDVDSVFNKAVKAGAKVERQLQNQFYGDRSGTLVDPFGHKWTIATRVEDLSVEEMEKRMKNQPRS